MSALSIRVAGLLVVASMLLSPAAALAVPPATGGEIVHVVQWGETLSLIASRYGVTMEAIMDANGLSNPDQIYAGQRLIIPTPGGPGVPERGGRHVVAPGETLTSIAFRYGTTVDALVAANGLSNGDWIYVGQVLSVPDGSSPAPVSGGCASSYVVQGGDTLSGIAWRYGMTVNALMQANGLYSDFIYEGQRLCMPPGGIAGPPPEPGPGPAHGPAPVTSVTYYKVRPGDTLSGIAWQFGVSQASIIRANYLADPYLIYVGQRLVIPGYYVKPKPSPLFKLAFSRWDGNSFKLYIANTDGSGEQFVLNRAGGPSWSPDGLLLSFYGQEGIDQQAQSPGGGNPKFPGISNGILAAPVAGFVNEYAIPQLFQIKREGSARATAWSPDGSVIAWDAKPGRDFRIYFGAAQGIAINQSVADVQVPVEIPGEQPDWSPDAAWLVYRSGRDNKQGIWISNRYGANSVAITNDGTDAFPRWSPDGRQIAFQHDSGGNVDVYVMNPDGSNIRRLTDAPGPDALPAWTPDGRIVFRSARTGGWGIYVMRADGKDQQQIIGNADPGRDWAFGRLDVHP
jgi:LysM repeat protein/Tol biopolymer transport system component